MTKLKTPLPEGSILSPSDVLEIEAEERSEIDRKVMGIFARQFRGPGRYEFLPPYYAAQVHAVLMNHWTAVEASGWEGLEFNVSQFGPFVLVDVYKPIAPFERHSKPRWWHFWRWT